MMKMGPRSGLAPFLMKTYEMVDDPGTNDVISWNDAGTTFVVWKIAEFAKDLLPNSFKHNNFSSFVRQLNTYGFRKTAPDKWEFANENFKRGQKELLTQIRRRKSVATSATPNPVVDQAAPVAAPTSPSNSSDLNSSSTSSPDSKNKGSVDTQREDKLGSLAEENEKLKQEKEILCSELAKTKKQCEDLITFLTKRVKVDPDKIDNILSRGNCETSKNKTRNTTDSNSDDDENEECLKLFGVFLKDGKKKRCREEKTDSSAIERKEPKKVEVNGP